MYLLVVEDEQAVADQLCQLLRQERYTCEVLAYVYKMGKKQK